MANEPRETYVDRHLNRGDAPNQTGQTVALWLLVALVLLMNYQVMQLNGEVKELQAERNRPSLSPTGPAPGTSVTPAEAPDYQAELESIINKMDRMGTHVESIDQNVRTIRSELGGGGQQPTQGYGYPGHQ